MTKLDDAFSIEFEITPPGGRSYDYYDDEADEDSDYTDYMHACESLRREVGLPGNTGSDADGPELRISLITWNQWPKVQELCRKLRAKGYWASEACGAHVHFDVRRFLTAEYEDESDYCGGVYSRINALKALSPAYGRFLCAWVGFEESLFRICKTSSHRISDWTNPLRGRRFITAQQGAPMESSMQFFSRFFQGSEERGQLQVLRSTGKYSLYPITYYGSAEVRMHDGTLNDTRLAAWIELVQTMMHGAEQYPLTFYKEMEALGETDKRTQYGLFKDWVQELDPTGGKNLITILERENP